MAHYQFRARTDRPTDDVFAYLSDLRNFADWDPGVKEAKQVQGDGAGLDAAYEVKASGASLRYEVQDFEPPRLIRAIGSSKTATSDDRITVEPDGTGSIVTYDARLHFNGVLSVLDPFLSLAFKRIGNKSADGLCEKLGATRLD